MADAQGTRKISRLQYLGYVMIILSAPPIVYLGFGRHMRFFEVPSKSMMPTVSPGDYLVTLDESEYRRGDIVVLNDPEDLSSYVIKRIVGVGGDTVAAQAGGLFVNGRYVPEPYAVEPMAYEFELLHVPQGGVFVLGDNRNDSHDSSQWMLEPNMDCVENVLDALGWQRCVPVEWIIGRVRYRYLPLARRGKVASYPLAEAPHGPPRGTFDYDVVQAMAFFEAAFAGEAVDWRAAARAWRDARPRAGTTEDVLWTWLNEARAWMNAGDVARARGCLASALLIDPNNPPLQALLSAGTEPLAAPGTASVAAQMP